MGIFPNFRGEHVKYLKRTGHVDWCHVGGKVNRRQTAMQGTQPGQRDT